MRYLIGLEDYCATKKRGQPQRLSPFFVNAKSTEDQ